MDLKEWTFKYIKYKDAFEKRVIEIKEKDDTIDVKRRDGDHIWIIKEKLDMQGLQKANYVICAHKKENLDFILKHWHNLARFKNLIIILVNLKADDKVIIRPYTHNLVADPLTLRQGLTSLFNSVGRHDSLF